MYIYLDESGDLGFDFSKAKTTGKFVVTLLCCRNASARKAIEVAVRRTLKKLNKPKSKSRRIEELKGTGIELNYKDYFLKQISDEQWDLYTIVLNKTRVNPDLRQKEAKPRLYNYLARLVLDKLPLEQAEVNVKLVVDRSKNREDIQEFNHYLRSHIESRLPLNTGFFIDHQTSHESLCLQAVDLFCWGVARKYNHHDCEWYEKYAHKLCVEIEYLK